MSLLWKSSATVIRQSSQFVALVVLASTTVFTAAQSSEIASATPLTNTEIVEQIAPRDLGDPRLTTHYYTFSGTRGDLLVGIEANNLNGSIDLFTASGLHPLLQITLYDSGSPLSASKSIFIRQEEDIILRVEARTPNDEEGTCRIKFGGAFVAAKPPEADNDAGVSKEEESTARLRSSGGKVRRVTSVGGRIAAEEEPTYSGNERRLSEDISTNPSSASALPVPSSTPSASGDSAAKVNAQPAPAVAVEPVSTIPERKDSPRPAAPPKLSAVVSSVPNVNGANDSLKLESEEHRSAQAPANKTSSLPLKPEAPKSTEPVKSGESAGAPPKTAERKPEAAKAEPLGPRLIIETKANEIYERAMSTILRVTVEKGQVVVIFKDGKIIRQPLSNLTRMSIVP